MRVLSTATGALRHALGATAEAAIIVAIGATLVLGVAVVAHQDPGGAESVFAARGGGGGGGGGGGEDPAVDMKFNLAVDHPDGTTLNENEVVYYAEKLKGGSTNGSYAVLHECYQDGVLVQSALKGIWFPNAYKEPGTAYFFALGDTCSGVVVDLAASADSTARGASVVSNTVTYGTNPLP